MMKDSQLYYGLGQLCVIGFAATGNYGVLALAAVYVALALMNLRREDAGG